MNSGTSDSPVPRELGRYDRMVMGGTAAKEMMLFDFNRENAMDGWFPVNDGVMGGISTGRLEPTSAGLVVFSGVVSLENNGGFASVRSREHTLDLRDYDGLAIRLRGDGKRYKVNLKTDSRSDGILYRAVFETRNGEWDTVVVPLDRFVPTFRGRVFRDAPPLDRSRVTSIGLMISDGQEGPFRLEVEWIRAVGD